MRAGRLPGFFNTGTPSAADFAPVAEGSDGDPPSYLAGASRQGGWSIAAGFVEREGLTLYDSIAADRGRTRVYAGETWSSGSGSGSRQVADL